MVYFLQNTENDDGERRRVASCKTINERGKTVKTKLTALLLTILLLLCGCGKRVPSATAGGTQGNVGGNITPTTGTAMKGDVTDLGDDNTSFGEDMDELGANDGYFSGDGADFSVRCVSGTENAYRIEGATLTFTAVSEETVYALSGQFKGNIVIDTGDGYKFDLELHGLSLVSEESNPITVLSGEEVAIKAKKETKNYIYDMRPAVDESNSTLHKGAVYAEVDLEIGGKGELTVVSEENNGIHTKGDLQVQNLTLFVTSSDNALKGNDSVTLTDCHTTLIATGGDAIKTTSSDVSSKGKQRGSVTVAGGTHTLYAACDGIDAAYNVQVEGAETVLHIYTDKYSNYSEEVTTPSAEQYYIRYTTTSYQYSVRFTNSETGETLWINAEYHSTVRGGRTTYYYYAFARPAGYDKMQLFIYSMDMQQQQDSEYAASSDVMTVSEAYDTIALSSRGYSWTNYSASSQGGGFGGMDQGNTDKGDYSTKGIKAANEIVIKDGVVNIKSYDDAIHANADATLENGDAPLGNVTVSGGTVTVYSNDDGLHADGALSVTAGTVTVVYAYEGIEGQTVSVLGGYVSVISKDDGINATATQGTAITVGGGVLYIYAGGDGIDANSRTAYSGILFSGGYTVVTSTSGGNSAIDTEQGYTYTGGCVVAVMPHGGMSGEATHCRNFSSIGKSTQISLSAGAYLVVETDTVGVTVKMPLSLSAYVIVLGDSSPAVSQEISSSALLDENGVAWE